MKLPKLDEGQEIEMKEALSRISDEDVLSYLNQQAIFEREAGWDKKVAAKLYAMLYQYEARITASEESLNDLEEAYRTFIPIEPIQRDFIARAIELKEAVIDYEIPNKEFEAVYGCSKRIMNGNIDHLAKHIFRNQPH